jgi:hypothetical protein
MAKAGYTSFRGGEATTTIPEFKGLAQYGDGFNADPRYATECWGIRTDGGVLRNASAPVANGSSLANKIETLAVFYRRWYAGAEADKTILVGAANGQLYYRRAETAEAWTLLSLPSGWSGASYANNVWSWTAYELNEEGVDPVDVLILSNADDGMIYVRGDTFAVTAVTTPYDFGIITRSNERIWGTKASDEPDMLCYSAPYDFTDWDADAEIPEDGGGDIRIPSWDGDSFSALVPLGSQLIAFKEDTVWRVYGTNPGEYTFVEQFGEGAPYPRTIAVNREWILTWGDWGATIYDGVSANPFQHDVYRTLLSTANKSYFDQCCGCIWKNKYYLAYPDGDSTTNTNVLIYDTIEKTWLLRTDVAVESFLPVGNTLFFTVPDEPGYLYTWTEEVWAHSITTTGTACATVRWVTPWFDYGSKNVNIIGLVVRFALDSPAAGDLTLTIETDRVTKEKTVHYDAPVAGKPRNVRVPFVVRGSRWRMMLETTGTNHWRLMGGLQFFADVETE